jgi:hypothetical protein
MNTKVTSSCFFLSIQQEIKCKYNVEVDANTKQFKTCIFVALMSTLFGLLYQEEMYEIHHASTSLTTKKHNSCSLIIGVIQTGSPVKKIN